MVSFDGLDIDIDGLYLMDLSVLVNEAFYCSTEQLIILIIIDREVGVVDVEVALDNNLNHFLPE
jgi:hypothetical protein